MKSRWLLLALCLCSTLGIAAKKKNKAENFATPECIAGLNVSRGPIDISQEVLQVVDREISDYLLGRQFNLTGSREFAFEYGLKAKAIDEVLGARRIELREAMRKKAAPPNAESVVRGLPPGLRERVEAELQPEEEKQKIEPRPKPPKRGLRPAFVSTVPKEDHRGAEQVPTAVERVASDWVYLERHRPITEPELELFRRWFLDPNINGPKAMGTLRTTLFGYAANLDPEPYRINSRYFLAAKRLCIGSQPGTHHSVYEEIAGLDHLANRTPIEIHRHLMSRGWNSPHVDPYRRILYLYLDPGFEYAAVVRLDQPRWRAHGAHAHKEIVAIPYLLKSKLRHALTFNSRDPQVKIYTDAGLLSDHPIYIPVHAATYPPELDMLRAAEQTDKSTWAPMRPYFFPEILKDIGYVWPVAPTP